MIKYTEFHGDVFNVIRLWLTIKNDNRYYLHGNEKI